MALEENLLLPGGLGKEWFCTASEVELVLVFEGECELSMVCRGLGFGLR